MANPEQYYVGYVIQMYKSCKLKNETCVTKRLFCADNIVAKKEVIHRNKTPYITKDIKDCINRENTDCAAGNELESRQETTDRYSFNSNGYGKL